jgi:hypothetical protein
MGALADICARMVELIPLEDHATVSALASTCHAAAPMLWRFLAVNDIIDARTIPRSYIYDCDLRPRFHGTMQIGTTFVERRIMWHGLLVPGVWPARTDTILTWSFGQLMEYQHIIDRRIYAKKVIAGQLVYIICRRHAPPGISVYCKDPLIGNDPPKIYQLFHTGDGLWRSDTSITSGAESTYAIRELLIKDGMNILASYCHRTLRI